jgi:hypothetical protein
VLHKTHHTGKLIGMRYLDEIARSFAMGEGATKAGAAPFVWSIG